MSSTADSSMPDRYRPDPWADTTITEWKAGRLRAAIPQIAFEWIGAGVGDLLAVAPKDTNKIEIGHSVPDILGEFQIYNKGGKEDMPLRKLPDWCYRYLDAEAGDTARFHNNDESVIVEVIRDE